MIQPRIFHKKSNIREENKSEILSYWQIQESLLQTYRGQFLTSESILFAIACVILTIKDPNHEWVFCLLFFLLCFLGMFISICWMAIVTGRGVFVKYFQDRLREQRFYGNIMTDFDKCKENERKKKIFANIIFHWKEAKKPPLFIARHIFGVWFPILFCSLWIILFLIALWPCLCAFWIYLNAVVPIEQCY